MDAPFSTASRKATRSKRVAISLAAAVTSRQALAQKRPCGQKSDSFAATGAFGGRFNALRELCTLKYHGDRLDSWWTQPGRKGRIGQKHRSERSAPGVYALGVAPPSWLLISGEKVAVATAVAVERLPANKRHSESAATYSASKVAAIRTSCLYLAHQNLDPGLGRIDGSANLIGRCL